MALNEITQKFDDIAEKRAALQAELNNLDAHEKEEKKQMRAGGIAEAQALIKHFSIAPDEVIFTAKRTLPPRFRDPETGNTWHGFGKRPEWINDDNIESYRIDPKKAKKAGEKPAKKTKSKAKQADAQQHEAANATVAATEVDSTPAKPEAAAVAENVAPKDSATISDFEQQPISAQSRQPAVNYGSSFMASGVRSYVTAVRDSRSS